MGRHFNTEVFPVVLKRQMGIRIKRSCFNNQEEVQLFKILCCLSRQGTSKRVEYNFIKLNSIFMLHGSLGWLFDIKHFIGK